MERNGTLWPLDAHTRGKHEVLRNYLKAWFPILGSSFDRILFIDGFAGPGKYEAGEEGSPLIALRTFLDHRARGIIRAEVVFFFIEKDSRRADHLQRVVDAIAPKNSKTCLAHVITGTFDGTMKEVLDDLERQKRGLAPAFVMIDPFGVSGTPMDVVRRILSNGQAEVYASFMYEAINRFKTTPEFEKHLDELFGCETWREGVSIQDATKKKDFFYGLYEDQLRHAGAKYVVHFDLYHGGRLVYAIFFATKHWMGSDRMKQAIWKVAPFGDFAFRGTRSAQLSLEIQNVNYGPLRRTLLDEFGGTGWTTVEKVEEFVGSDRTDYHTGHMKRCLAAMEDSKEIEVDANSRKRRRTFPDGTKLRFAGRRP